MPIVVCEQCGAKNRVAAQIAERLEPRCGRCGNGLDLKRAGEADGSKPVVITDSTFDHEVLGAGPRPVLLDCWAPWCGPCRALAPVLEQLAAESKGKYLIGKLNVDENPRVAGQFAIQSIPTMLIFKEGVLIDRIIGAQPKAAIAAKLARAGQITA